MPSEKNCSLYISGTEVEVMSAAVAHAIADHGHKDTQELRAEIKSGFQAADAGPTPAARTKFSILLLFQVYFKLLLNLFAKNLYGGITYDFRKRAINHRNS